MKIALAGSRGIPACYSGFETFYEALAVRLAQRGHHVTVFNRSHVITYKERYYRGVRLVRLPSIPTKHLDTIVHTFLSSLYLLFHRHDIVYYSIVGNSPLVWIPRLRGANVLLNVDGQDWAREKWSGFAKTYQRWCERIAGRTAHLVIADAKVIQRRYREDYGVDSVYVPYGTDCAPVTSKEALTEHGLQPREYLLFVGRLVPENAIELLIRAHAMSAVSMPLVIVGDAPYANAYRQRLRDLAGSNVIFTGYVFGKSYHELSSHAYAYIQPSAIEGTRPALLDQLGFGNAVLVRRASANMDVIGSAGESFDGHGSEGCNNLAMALQALIADPERVNALRQRARQRILTYYNWEWIADFYEEIFHEMGGRRGLQDYDAFVRQRVGGQADD